MKAEKLRRGRDVAVILQLQCELSLKFQGILRVVNVRHGFHGALIRIHVEAGDEVATQDILHNVNGTIEFLGVRLRLNRPDTTRSWRCLLSR